MVGGCIVGILAVFLVVFDSLDVIDSFEVVAAEGDTRVRPSPLARLVSQSVLAVVVTVAILACWLGVCARGKK